MSGGVQACGPAAHVAGDGSYVKGIGKRLAQK
jgi:hypothetical protein